MSIKLTFDNAIISNRTLPRKSRELRGGVTERERFQIESHYDADIIGDLEKTLQLDEVWAQTYPRDDSPLNQISVFAPQIGQYDKALDAALKRHRLAPGSTSSYAHLADAYLYLNDIQKAEAILKEAQAKKLDSPRLHISAYFVAFLRQDLAGMNQQVVWAHGKPSVEGMMLENEADTAAFFGKLAKARDLSRQAVTSAKLTQENEAAEIYEINAIRREALFGNVAEARRRARLLGARTGGAVQYDAAMTLAIAGDASKAQALADDLAKRSPEDTVAQFCLVPTIHAQIALSRNDPSRAMEALRAAVR